MSPTLERLLIAIDSREFKTLERLSRLTCDYSKLRSRLVGSRVGVDFVLLGGCRVAGYSPSGPWRCSGWLRGLAHDPK